MADSKIQSHSFRGSSRVRSAKWDPETKTLTVEFLNGVMWRYGPVTKRVWNGFLSAGSAGGYVTEVLNKYSMGQI